MEQESPVRLMTPLERLVSNAKFRLGRWRRRLPYLVWWNDELDVTVTLMQDKLPEIVAATPEDLSEAFRALNSGAFAAVERTFSEMGIGFDKGMGCDGRDWEWDWSLKGPISVRFRGRASKPELRRERPTPKLVVNNPAA